MMEMLSPKTTYSSRLNSFTFSPMWMVCKQSDRSGKQISQLSLFAYFKHSEGARKGRNKSALGPKVEFLLADKNLGE
jgi:hypothetical protein